MKLTRIKDKVQSIKFALPRLVIMALLATLLPLPANAAQLTNRTLTLSSTSSAASNATTTYTFSFNFGSSTAVKSVSAQICTSASGTCTIPTGFSVSSSTVGAQPTGLGATTGWTVNTATAGSLRQLNASNATAPSGTQTVTFGNVQNPTSLTPPNTFYARFTTYSDAAWTTPIDTGTMASAPANQITFSGTVDESLTFCVGVTVDSACATTTGTSVAFGTFSTSTAKTSTSQFAAATNANGGYVVTANGTTLTSGTNTIANNTTAAASSPGSSQFGFNLSTAHKSANSFGAPNTGYASATAYRYNTGDTIAQSGPGGSAGPSDFDTYTANYLVNISGIQAAGLYTTTLTFICTATF